MPQTPSAVWVDKHQSCPSFTGWSSWGLWWTWGTQPAAPVSCATSWRSGQGMAEATDTPFVCLGTSLPAKCKLVQDLLARRSSMPRHIFRPARSMRQSSSSSAQSLQAPHVCRVCLGLILHAVHRVNQSPQEKVEERQGLVERHGRVCGWHVRIPLHDVDVHLPSRRFTYPQHPWLQCHH